MNKHTGWILGTCLGVAGALWTASCDTGPRLVPTLCLRAGAEPSSGGGGDGVGGGLAFDAPCDVDAASLDAADLTECPAAVVDGSGFVLRHELPPEVEPIGTLKVHLDTPCEGGDSDVEVTHVDGVALLYGTVPPGGECGFEVSAIIANSDLRCDVRPESPCSAAKLAGLCDAAAR